MLYKTLVAAFVVSSGDALRIDGLNSRRAAITSAASALSLVPLAAFAELKQAGRHLWTAFMDRLARKTQNRQPNGPPPLPKVHALWTCHIPTPNALAMRTKLFVSSAGGRR
jgi:hypothetical protein